MIWRSTCAAASNSSRRGAGGRSPRGRITTYPGKSNYQIVIDALEPAGIGALMALLEERKKKLAAEGLFDEARKQPLPFLPRVIGVVTSPTGAVIRDMLHRLRRALSLPRAGLAGARAGRDLRGRGGRRDRAASTRSMAPGRLPRPDVLIVARGGGSLEDLWGFNEEIVARAAAASAIPLISAVGHETDWTLIDLCRRFPRADADRRRRARRAGARRPAHHRDAARPARRHLAAGGGSTASGIASPGWRAACRAKPIFSTCRASASTMPARD